MHKVQALIWKLNQEIASARARAHNTQVQAAIRQLNQEITTLMEKQAKANPQDDKLTMFRQQARMNARSHRPM